MECWGVSGYSQHIHFSKHHSDSSNPTASTGVDRCQTEPCKNHSVSTTRATRKTTRFGVRDAKNNAAGAMHRVAWALQTAKGTGQKCEKPWENLWFCSGEDRNRTFGCFPNGFGEFERWLSETGILPKNPTGGRFAWTNSLSGQKCLFRLGPTQDPKIQVSLSWHLVLVSVAIPS